MRHGRGGVEHGRQARDVLAPARVVAHDAELELSAAAQSRLNVLDERASRWSAEVTLRKRADEPDAPGMFVSLTAKDVAPEVFSCAFESPETHPNAHPNPRSPTRSVLVLRGERRCVEGDVPVKEYLSRCKTYKLAHKSKVDGVRFWAGDFAVGVARVENMQGTYVGAVVEIEYAPLVTLEPRRRRRRVRGPRRRRRAKRRGGRRG